MFNGQSTLTWTFGINALTELLLELIQVLDLLACPLSLDAGDVDRRGSGLLYLDSKFLCICTCTYSHIHVPICVHAYTK